MAHKPRSKQEWKSILTKYAYNQHDFKTGQKGNKSVTDEITKIDKCPLKMNPSGKALFTGAPLKCTCGYHKIKVSTFMK